RIATYLRDGEEAVGPARPDGFDIPGVLDTVRGFPGVQYAQVRVAPDGLHTLRLELAEDADPGQVSREGARLLKVRMGLAAEPHDDDPLRPLVSAAAAPAEEMPFAARPAVDLAAAPVSLRHLPPVPLRDLPPVPLRDLPAAPVPAMDLAAPAEDFLAA